MKDILIIAHFTQTPDEHGNSRFVYIANMLSKSGYNVEVVTTQFSHRKKKRRKVTKEQLEKINYKLTMLEEPSYQNNISLKRFYSHYRFGKNLKKYLKDRKKPDLIYCAIPSLDAAYVAARYSTKKNVKFVLDIQDLWPEAFTMVFNIPFLKEIIFFPMKKKAEYIYKSADRIISVSNTYLSRALKVNDKCKGISVYLGTDLSYFDSIKENNIERKVDNEIWIAYIGTLGYSYDLTTVIDAIYILKSRGFQNINFLVMGDGPLKKYFEEYAIKKGVHTIFTGRLSYEDMVRKLSVCDIAVNPIKSSSAASIINKVGDYAAAGLPVLNTQNSQEYRQLLEEYNAGINCINNDPINLADCLSQLLEDEEMRKEMGRNNRRLAEEKFDGAKTYKKILSLIKKL